MLAFFHYIGVDVNTPSQNKRMDGFYAIRKIGRMYISVVSQGVVFCEVTCKISSTLFLVYSKLSLLDTVLHPVNLMVIAFDIYF